MLGLAKGSLLHSCSWSRILTIRSLTKSPKSILPLFSEAKVRPPYSHFVQLGDPVLRVQCDPVPREEVTSPSVRGLVGVMKEVLNMYDGVGVSAPQVGVSLQIMVIQLTARQLDRWTKEAQASRGMEVIPFKVFINPSIKVVDWEKISKRESCCSMHGYSGQVTRYKSVVLTGLNLEGEEVSWTVSDWTARVVQHEVDHLQGKMFTDRLDTVDSLAFDYWNVVNSKAGQFKLGFGGIQAGPRKWFTGGWLLKQGK